MALGARRHRPSTAGTCRRDARRSRPGAVIVPARRGSIASGMPSRRRQMRTMASMSRSASSSAPASSARIRNRATDAPPRPVTNEPTRRTRSPSTSSGSRDVASTPTPGHDDTMALVASATASSRCSQLSRMSNDSRNRRPSMSDSRWVATEARCRASRGALEASRRACQWCRAQRTTRRHATPSGNGGPPPAPIASYRCHPRR